MKFSINREALLRPLQQVAGVVERRQTLPILSNVLLSVEGSKLSMTGTDLEVEMVGHLQASVDLEGEITVPARKFVDICRELPDQAEIDITLKEDRLEIRSGRFRSNLSTLPASDFPAVDTTEVESQVELHSSALKQLLDLTGFAMAQQDVRYYLNGMYLELKEGRLRFVATDGHRLALCTAPGQVVADDKSVIVPRKGILELSRLLDGDGSVTLSVGSNHIRAATDQFTFTSKLVDGKFPEYERVLPRSPDKSVTGDRSELRQAFTRTAILSNEKYRGVRLSLTPGSLEITANNPEQEQAEESVPVDYAGDALEVGFNVSYLLDVMGVLTGSTVRMSLSDSASSALIEEGESGGDADAEALYVVMPMRL